MNEDDVYGESLGPLIRGLRREAGLTQEELAERAGLSTRTVSNLENSRSRQPRQGSIERIIGHLAPDEQATRRLRRLAAGIPASRTPAQLPTAHAGFVDRDAEQQMMLNLLDASGPGHPDPAVILVHGQPGIGKTALTLRVAHQAAERFPDGALYADLQGSGSPADPHPILAGWCRALGVSPEAIPRDLQQRAAHLRSLLAGRRVLIVCDDARDVAQIRPLLPGTAGCAALITSRLAFTAPEIADYLPLGLLDAQAAVELVRAAVTRRSSAQRSRSTDPGNASELIARITAACGGLPLALRIAADRLAHHPAWTLTAYAELLENSGDRLWYLQLNNSSVRAAFDASYYSLSRRPDGAAVQELFDQFAVHDGPFLTLDALAAITGEPEVVVELRMDMLCQMHLAESPAPHRYAMSELLRIYGRDHLPAAGRRQVTAALAGYFTGALRNASDDAAWLNDQWSNVVATAVAAAAGQPELTTSLNRLLTAAVEALLRHPLLEDQVRADHASCLSPGATPTS
jgi:DNA-binding XRE family transcriptional regulator